MEQCYYCGCWLTSDDLLDECLCVECATNIVERLRNYKGFEKPFIKESKRGCQHADETVKVM